MVYELPISRCTFIERLSRCGLKIIRIATTQFSVAVMRMLQTDVLIVENEEEVFSAMTALREGQGSFSDVIISALGTVVPSP